MPTRSLKVGNDAAHGIAIEVSLAEDADAVRARQVLGQYVFQFRLLPNCDRMPTVR